MCWYNVLWRKCLLNVYSKFLPSRVYLTSNIIKAPFFIFADLECLIKTKSETKKCPAKSSTEKVSEHILCGYWKSNIYAFDDMHNKHNGYRGEDWMKKFSELLKEHAMEIIDFGKNKMMPLTNTTN